MHVGHMLKMCKEEFDRLMETSPSIVDKIISQFNRTFPSNKPIKPVNTQNEIIRPDIKRPEICDELVSTAEIVLVTKEVDRSNTVPSMVEIARQKNKILEAYEQEVLLWSSKFEDKHNRKPLESELFDNLQHKMNPEILTKIIKKITNEAKTHQSTERDPLNIV